MKQDIKTPPACKVCKNPIEVKGMAVSEQRRLLEVGICSTCDHWVLQWQDRNSVLVTRIEGQHYRIGSPKAHPRDKGMGGRSVIIQFFDGREVETDNLWHQGNIPEDFKFSLPDNAIFKQSV